MATVRLDKVYSPTVRAPSGPLVLMTRPQSQSSRALQVIAKPCSQVAEVIFRTALECKKRALQATALVLIKLTAIGKSIINFVKKDFLKKEGIPLKGLVIYRGSRGMGRRMVKKTI